jgi:hypothetical protein
MNRRGIVNLILALCVDDQETGKGGNEAT